MNTAANRLKIILFAGLDYVVNQHVNTWLAEQPAGVRVVAMEYNYQGTEYHDGEPIAQGEHGILIAYTVGEDA